MIYTLMDTETGNLMSTYDTEREVLALVQGAIVAYGTEYADILALGREDSDGRTILIAEGQELAERALLPSPSI